MSNHAWMELTQVSNETFDALVGSKPSLEAVVCCLSPRQHAKLTTVILEAIPSKNVPKKDRIYLHPMLYDLLVQAAERTAAVDDERGQQDDDAAAVDLSIAPLPIEGYSHEDAPLCPQHKRWTLSRIENVLDLPIGCHVSITCIYHDSSGTCSGVAFHRQVTLALEGRLIRANSLLIIPTLSGVCILLVTNIAGEAKEAVCRVGSCRDFELELENASDSSPDRESNPMQPSEWEQNCPGYKKLLDELVSLSQLDGVASPSGVLLTGCSGVGKSRLASCLAHHVSTSESMSVQWVSAQDLLARASWSSEEDFLGLLLPPLTTERKHLLVIDDLQILASEDKEDDVLSDPELLLVHNSILEALARLSSLTPNPFILGIAHDASLLPQGLTRIGRLEKELHMDPPTQVQREAILDNIMTSVENVEKRFMWGELLAAQTAGCVASDLVRLSAAAWTTAWSRSTTNGSDDNVELSWVDLRDAAYSIVPSQLAQLDVTKTAAFPENNGPLDPLKIHEWSWRTFGGYDETKKRLYRTVVMPWRRLIVSTTGRVGGDDDKRAPQSWVSPPSGVLFHGRPGVGKTLAAGCLASSLGLHVVKVRASDVLDQWLGGSEAVIRSLFSRARAAAPCILFFDEIDAIACNREDDESSVDVSSRILTTFLNEMDGISSGGSSGVLVVACTNRLGALDAALLRPGRLDEHVHLPMPDQDDVSEIIRLRLATLPLSNDVKIDELAELMVELGASGADVEGVCRDACSRVIRQAKHLSSDLVVSNNDFLSAIREWRQ